MVRANTLKIRLISGLVLLVALVFVGRLYFLQIVYGSKYSEMAEHQYVNTNSIAYDRGEIYFETKTGEQSPAAMTRSGFTLAVNPKLVKDPEDLYKNLSNHLVLDKEIFIKKVSDKSDSYVEIEKKINKETIDKIKPLKLAGVIISTEKWRFYPGATLAAQVLGFVSYKGDALEGSYGLEKYYEETLRRDPSLLHKNFFADLFSNIEKTVSGAPSQGSLVTTIEPSLELFVQNKLKETRVKWGSDSAGAIVINPQNGEIYAMAFEPSFNLNEFNQEKNPAVYSNPLVEGVFEMGSIIKAITMASGLDAGAVKSTSIYYDAGTLTLNKKTISNYDGRGRGTVNMQEVLNQSLNTGAAYVALKLGNEDFSEYLKSFGLGTETGIDLPNETKGLINNLDSSREIEMATASYGQGIALTPVETVRALSVLGNGGKLVTPHVVKSIKYDNGLSKKITFEPGRQVIKPETSAEISRMLTEVVDKALAGGKAKVPGYSIAAKTGTAQMSDEGRRGYVEGKYLHSFFGYFPAQNPRFLVFLFHTYPKGVKYASETLTEPFMDITKFIINYYEVPPDRAQDGTDSSTVDSR